MTDTTTTRRLPPRERRKLILAAAQELFHSRSFGSVGMRDVADACELSAPGIYRHFASKEALLIGLFDRLSDQLSAAIRSASRANDAKTRLAVLIDFHVDQAIEEPALIPIYLREQASLDPSEQGRCRDVLRAYLAAWLEPLAELQPELSDAAARTTVVALFGLLNSPAFHRTALSELALRRLLTELAWRTLGVAQPQP